MDKNKLVLKRAHVFIDGKVQRVGFRYFVQTKAQEMGIEGWVKNLADGRVEAVFEGPKPNVLIMIEKCRKGPRASRVDNIDLNWEKTDNNLESFRVK